MVFDKNRNITVLEIAGFVNPNYNQLWINVNQNKWAYDSYLSLSIQSWSKRLNFTILDSSLVFDCYLDPICKC